jgi:ABC-type lipoprotein export system ATPase subunit
MGIEFKMFRLFGSKHTTQLAVAQATKRTLPSGESASAVGDSGSGSSAIMLMVRKNSNPASRRMVDAMLYRQTQQANLERPFLAFHITGVPQINGHSLRQSKPA